MTRSSSSSTSEPEEEVVEPEPEDVNEPAEPEPTFDPKVSSYPDEVNNLGDQDAINAALPQYPAGSDIPNAENVRRYPELFDADVIASFDTELEETPHEAALREAAESDSDS